MLARLILSTVAILITARIMDSVNITPWWVAAIISVVLGAINTFIKPIIQILSIPITIITLGFFSLVINASMILICAKIIGEPHFHVDGFWSAMFFSIILSIVNWVIHQIFDPPKNK
ncbi:MAG: phage holin family protein [Muribaculaceae bacterium]|nr:phage holin family protein [Muribaculaceae bacterium]